MTIQDAINYAASGKKTLIRTLSGAMIDVGAPDWRLIALEDAAHALVAMRRWNGHLRRQTSILEHQLNVAAEVPKRLRLAAALHDVQEYIIGDWARPVVSAIVAELPEFKTVMQGIRGRCDLAIAWAVIVEARGGDPHEILESEAEELAHEMHHAAVRVADDLIGAAEFSAYHPQGDGVLGRRLDLTEVEPAAELLVRLWLKIVRMDARDRYGK
jgi:hypothetical protein